MGIQDMMTDKVDVYKLKKRTSAPSYGVPTPDEYYYDTLPDIEKVPCSIQQKSSPLVSQGDPFLEVKDTYTMYLPLRFNVSERDKVEFNGVFYYLGLPMSYRNHQKVSLERVEPKWQSPE
jgi:hypothetical protein